MAPIRNRLVLFVKNGAVMAPLIVAVGTIGASVWIACEQQRSSALPDTGWRPLLGAAGRTMLISGIAATISGVVGACVVLSVFAIRSTALRRVMFAAAVVPALVPPAVTATVLQRLGSAALIVAASVVAMPYAVIGQTLALRYCDVHAYLAARDLGLSRWPTWQVSAAPVWRFGAGAAWVWGVFLISSDPTIYQLLSGNRSFLPSHTLRAVLGGAPTSQMARVLTLYLVPACALAAIAVFLARRTRATMRESHDVYRIADLVKARWLIWGSGAVTVAAYGFIAYEIVRLAVAAAQTFPIDFAAMVWDLAPTVLLVVVVLPLSTLFGTVLALAVYRAPRVVRTFGWWLIFFMMFAAPPAVGAVLAMGFRTSIAVGPFVLPALVGGSAVFGGKIALVIAAMSVCVPVTAMLVLAVRSTQQGQIHAAARDLGATAIRSTFQVEGPALMPIVAIALCVEASLVLTYAAPVTFVQPVGVSVAASRIATLATTGFADEALAFSVLTGTLVALCMAWVYAVVRSTFAVSWFRTEPYRRKHG
jgi:iron(III) transport system permease protein